MTCTSAENCNQKDFLAFHKEKKVLIVINCVVSTSQFASLGRFKKKVILLTIVIEKLQENTSVKKSQDMLYVVGLQLTTFNIMED